MPGEYINFLVRRYIHSAAYNKPHCLDLSREFL